MSQKQPAQKQNVLILSFLPFLHSKCKIRMECLTRHMRRNTKLELRSKWCRLWRKTWILARLPSCRHWNHQYNVLLFFVIKTLWDQMEPFFRISCLRPLCIRIQWNYAKVWSGKWIACPAISDIVTFWLVASENCIRISPLRTWTG